MVNIVFERKIVYGLERFYPVNPKGDVEALTSLTGKKSYTSGQLMLLKHLGLVGGVKISTALGDVELDISKIAVSKPYDGLGDVSRA